MKGGERLFPRPSVRLFHIKAIKSGGVFHGHGGGHCSFNNRQGCGPGGLELGKGRQALESMRTVAQDEDGGDSDFLRLF